MRAQQHHRNSPHPSPPVTPQESHTACIGFVSGVSSSLDKLRADHGVRLLSWSFSGASSASAKYDSWHQLGLSYDVDWPLFLVITPDSLSKYDEIFRFLLSLKRVEADLQRAWGALFHTRYRWENRGSKGFDILNRMWHTRSRMAHILDSLLYFVHVDIIEGEYRRMIGALLFHGAGAVHALCIAFYHTRWGCRSPTLRFASYHTQWGCRSHTTSSMFN